MRPGMYTEIWRIVLVGVVAFLFGWNLGYPLEVVMLGIGVYILWTFRIISLLFKWIDKGMRGIPPEMDGVWGEISDTLKSSASAVIGAPRSECGSTIKRVTRLTEALDEGILVLRRDLTIDWWNRSAATPAWLCAPADRGSSGHQFDPRSRTLSAIFLTRTLRVLSRSLLSTWHQLSSTERLLKFSASRFGAR